MWSWTGIVYHGLFFSAIDRVAFLFGTLFVLQGALFTWGAFSGRITLGVRGGDAGSASA